MFLFPIEAGIARDVVTEVGEGEEFKNTWNKDHILLDILILMKYFLSQECQM